MRRIDLEHIIRASGSIANDDEIIIIGSQAILGQFPDAPSSLLVSVEVDVFPKNKMEYADLIDGSIGELSPFHATFGYYAHGVGPETSILPEGWRDRLVRVCNENTRGVVGWCLEVHDLAIAKYAAGREKDLNYTKELATQGMVKKEELLRMLKMLSVSEELKEVIKWRIEKSFQCTE